MFRFWYLFRLTPAAARNLYNIYSYLFSITTLESAEGRINSHVKRQS